MNVSIKLITVILLFLLIALVTCKDGSVDPSDTSSLFPIKVGNSWKYNYKDFDSTGAVTYENQFNETFIHSRVRDGELVYQFSSPLNPPSPACCDYRYYFQNQEDGVHRLIAVDSTGYWLYDILWYKYPCNKNDFFTNGRHDRDTTFVISVNETVVCEAGIFNCIVYKNNIPDLNDSTFSKTIGIVYNYVAKGIGKVKYELYWTTSAGILYKDKEHSLASYILK